MVVGIDLTTDTVLGQYKLVEPDNVTYFEVPDDFDFRKYDYIPQQAGVYSFDNFVEKQIEEQDPRIQQLVDTGLFTETQAIAFISIQNNP